QFYINILSRRRGCPTNQGKRSNRQPFLHHDLILLKSMETWGAASPKRLTVYVNRAFIEMNFSLRRPFTLFQPAIRGMTKQKI
ncbi:MAG: hypothetical protein ACO24D_16245, partial [bacterium]